ncbi:hypothetical protein [Streptomyces sp. NPDC020742]|uniref:hypothetical protein n=1 Tax=unclassified Streptomyces TaxID=2593676 RepID=UPI0033F7F256
MPRPTATQLVYGSATVFLATLAMLLLSQTQTGIGVAVIAIAGLGLGLLVAMTASIPGVSRVVRRHVVRSAPPAGPAPLQAVPSPTAPVPPPGACDGVPRRRLTEAAGATEARVGEHSR